MGSPRERVYEMLRGDPGLGPDLWTGERTGENTERMKCDRNKEKLRLRKEGVVCCTLRGKVGWSLKGVHQLGLHTSCLWHWQEWRLGDEVRREPQSQEWDMKRRNSTLNASCEKSGSEREQRENSLRSIRGLEGFLTSFVLFEKC